jgi:hypothetical protein
MHRNMHQPLLNTKPASLTQSHCKQQNPCGTGTPHLLQSSATAQTTAGAKSKGQCCVVCQQDDINALSEETQLHTSVQVHGLCHGDFSTEA